MNIHTQIKINWKVENTITEMKRFISSYSLAWDVLEVPSIFWIPVSSFIKLNHHRV